ncbi:hypothetical protein Pen02_70530 [Plantactinospora endophytica]|uniref:Uncharacterized protein n=1 Tax=Plantactinospora endophytica TaxID=673535 RepID=A0ABQ4ED02_9ACTN|nr:hypothetical protein Pen02_70530 [Plantactinospora endophytica]
MKLSCARVTSVELADAAMVATLTRLAGSDTDNRGTVGSQRYGREEYVDLRPAGRPRNFLSARGAPDEKAGPRAPRSSGGCEPDGERGRVVCSTG